MFMILFIVLVVAWLFGSGALHIAGGLIHLRHPRSHFVDRPLRARRGADLARAVLVGAAR
jgi:hypothetical protein